jgi:hypothetical protein
VAGIDVQKKHLVMTIWYFLQKRMLAFAGFVEFADLPDLFDRYRITTCTIDLNPETRMVNAAKEKLPQLYSCDFLTGLRGHHTEFTVDRVARHIKVHRTVMCDRVMMEFQTKAMGLPLNARGLAHGEFYKQMQVPVRALKEVSGQPYAYWTDESSGHAFDFFMSVLYSLVAELSQPIPRIISMQEETPPDTFGTSIWLSMRRDLFGTPSF